MDAKIIIREQTLADIIVERDGIILQQSTQLQEQTRQMQEQEKFIVETKDKMAAMTQQLQTNEAQITALLAEIDRLKAGQNNS